MISLLFGCIILSFLTWEVSSVSNMRDAFTKLQTRDQVIAAAPIKILYVRSHIRCLAACLDEPSCLSFNFRCDPDVKQRECELTSSSLEVDSLISKTGFCYSELNIVTRRERQAVQIRAASEIGVHICHDSSLDDIIIVTTIGAFVYDNPEDIARGTYCRGPEPLSVLFTSYTDLPDAKNVDALMYYSYQYIELISGEKAWTWYPDYKTLTPAAATSQTLADAGYGVESPSKVTWSTFRRPNDQRHLYGDGHHFLLYGFQQVVANFSQSDHVVSPGGDSLNPWYKLPCPTISAVSRLLSDTLYVIFCSDDRYYYYKVESTNDPQNLDVTTEYKGLIKFYPH